MDEKHIPPSHFPSLEECQDKIGTLYLFYSFESFVLRRTVFKSYCQNSNLGYFTENDPGMDSLCWCTCCKDERGRHDGCYCPKWYVYSIRCFFAIQFLTLSSFIHSDRSDKAKGELMFDPTFRAPQKLFQPLLCPMELDLNDAYGCSFRVWNVEDEMDSENEDKSDST